MSLNIPQVLTLSSIPLVHSLTPLQTNFFGIHSRGSELHTKVFSPSHGVTGGDGGMDVSTA